MIFTLQIAGAFGALIHCVAALVEAKGATARIFELLHRKPRIAG
jgi:hypothetical protein